MGNTFGGEWHRPGERRGKDRQRSNSRRQLENWASYDNEPQNDCLSSLFLLSVLATATVAAIRGRK